MTIIIYGIKSCDTMKKTFAKLNSLNIEYVFHDYKKQSIDKDSVQRWVDELGIDKILNKRGTTWRKLSDEQREAADNDVNDAIELLIANTSMIKRPIIEGNYNDKPIMLCGYDEATLNEIFNE